MKALRLSFWTQDTNWLGRLNDLTAGQVIWGSGSGSGMGRMNFHSATFAVTNSIVASYDAGAHGNPAVAPSPVTQGWTETTGTARAEMASMKLQHVSL